MLSPNALSWRRINSRTGQLVGTRISLPAARCSQDDGTQTPNNRRGCVAVSAQAGKREYRDSAFPSLEPRHRSISMENFDSLPDCPGSDKTDLFQRNLKTMREFQSTRGLRDNREKLSDYLKQCESSMPRHGNAQLTEIDADLQATWNQPASDKNATTSKSLKQQAAIWELFQTELNILRHLKTIIEIYVAVLHHLQANANLLTDVSTDRLFPNITEVFGAHCTLWTQHLKPALLRARTNGCPVRPRELAPGFTDFQGIFEPSLGFCLSIAECKDYLKLQEKNEAFNDFVKWAQRLSSKNYNLEDGSMDLQLKSLLTTPFQRLTKYGLLLQEILKHTDDSEDREALDEMIRHVTYFCNRVNSSYQEKTEQEEVRSVSDRLQEDVKLSEQIDSLGEECSGYLEQFRLSLTRPMPHNGQPRRKLGEADFRLKDDKKLDVKLLLFTDLLLLAKVGGKRQSLRLLRAPVRLDKLAFYRLSDSNSIVTAVLTDFGSLDSLLCLSAADQKQCDDWLERLSQSQAALRQQLAASGRADGRFCENCGCEKSAPTRPKMVQRWMSETAAPTQAGSSSAAAVAATSGRSRTTLLEVATASKRQQQQHPGNLMDKQQHLLHLTHSSGEIETMNRSNQQLPDPGLQEQQCHIVIQRHLYQHLHIQHPQQHHREKSAPAVQGRARMLPEQLRCNSADEAATTADEAGSRDASSAAARDITQERRRLISFVKPSNQAPQV